jgi:hypothetical protein
MLFIRRKAPAMRSLLLGIILIVAADLPAVAEYRPLPLSYMVLTADTIIDASIVRVDSKYFYVRSLDKETDQNMVKVSRYQDWPCSKRWDSYKTGQHVLLLLQKEKDAYRIMSAGGEGEIPVINDSVTIDLWCLPIEDRWIVNGWGVSYDTLKSYIKRVGNKGLYGRSFSFEELKYGVYQLRRYYRMPATGNACSLFMELPRPEEAQDPGRERLFALLRKDFYDRKKNCRQTAV